MRSVIYRSSLFTLIVVFGLFASLRTAAAEPVFSSPKEAAADPDFAIQGEYTGPNVGVQVIALGKGTFTATIYKGGLPGAGWNERDRNEDENDAAGIQQLVQSLKLKKTERFSPTLGLKAPAGSVVVFDGTPETLQKQWKAGAKVTAEGLLMPGCASSQNFTDFSLHIEFQLPFMPEARGQGRGNSGIYCQGRFETQMLDSFGLLGKDNECGGLYSIKAPDINMCLPPLSWQTYDLDFTATRWGEKGIAAPARITVRHNGVVIHRDVELPQTVTANAAPGTIEAGPILLQDHGNPVRYRNIWLVPRNAEQEARRPYLPGFERFHAATSAVPADGGRLLLGELNCVACHQADAAQAAGILPKQSPVLDEVGKRIQPEFLLSFLANPHAVKPGTTMPDLLSGLPIAERDKAVLALVNYLVRTDAPAELSSEPAAGKRGKQLFHQIGCVACHAPDTDTKNPPRGSIPLSDLKAKYTIPSLASFLQEPHRVRPSARMPSFNLEKTEAVDLASYLIGDVNVVPRNPNMKFAAYEGSWEKVPKFEDLKPYKTGQAAGLDLTQAGREGNFGMRFTGFLKIEREGDYTFHIGSDDGSLLFIDGKKVADSDGIHPHTVQTGRTHLKSGLHPIQVDYTQGGGEWTLTLQFEGPGVPLQDVARVVQMTEQGNPTPPPAPQTAKPRFVFEPELVAQGQTLFTSLGCANCHQLKRDGKTVAALPVKPLSKLDPTKGCLAVSRDATRAVPATDPLQPGIGSRIPQFDLNFNQLSALTAALTTPASADSKLSATQSIAHTMAAFNCYACHSRDKVGGPERDRNSLFVSAIPEMGDEGRVPPPLDGVGDKLNEDWMRHVLDNGARDRPYMLTRMPKFGGANVGHLTAAFVATDR
ncbi:MAG: petJ, partial [Planctomycetaceae bacterium]|nr:petJ [Planctomycetaceae bacterium]